MKISAWPAHQTIPVPLSSLVGRDREVEEISATLRKGERLVTVTGPGGIGKTRVAMQVGRRLSDEFVDGVFVVNLASVREQELVPVVFAGALGILEGHDNFAVQSETEDLHDVERSWQRIVARLRDRELLAILDNFEQLLAGGPALSVLLEHCPGVRVLVTSRTSLRLNGEHSFPLSPLDWPDPKADFKTEDLMRSDAVRLFVERGQSVRPDFRLTDANARSISIVCSRLQGVPLAIELAAARLRSLPVDALAERLGKSLTILSDGRRDLPERHRDMNQTIAWSYELLSETQRRAFRSLGVFAGGFDADAASAIVGFCNPDETLDLLAVFVDNSLLVMAADGRFTMFETIREFCLDRLIEAGDSNDAQNRHAAYFTQLAERSASLLITSNAVSWLVRLENEHENLRGALRWLLDQRASREAQRLAGSLHWFWFLHSHFHEGRRWLTEAIATSPASEIEPVAQLGLGILAYDQADYESATACFDQSLRLAEGIDDQRLVARSLQFHGLIAYRQGRYGDMHRYLQKSLALSRAEDFDWGVAVALCNLGMEVPGTDPGQARESLEEGIVIFRRIGDPWGLASAANALGEHARTDGQLELARTLYEESLGLYKSIGNENSSALVSHNLGCVALGLRQFPQALSQFAEGLRLHHKHGDQRGVAHCLAGLAGALGQCGQAELACQLFGSAEVLFEVTGSVRDPVDQIVHDQNIVQVVSLLGPTRTDELWKKGRDLVVDLSVSAALEMAWKVVSGAQLTGLGPLVAARNSGVRRLTPRETEVMRLIVEGESDSAIATQLGISRKTASRHVESILSKLGVRNRTGAATLAVREGLI
jgi:predicted ATPase/DNA-binding CsgD family transcriptional regulator